MNSRPAFKPELLLPAGGMESVVAAVQNGADAVYLGGRQFSARQNAENFDEEALEQAVRYCKARGVKIYQTLNTLLFDNQFAEAKQAVRLACRIGIDAFIVQDWGVVRLIRTIAPDMPVHGSTQMSVHTPAGARLLKAAGLSRVVLAREMSLEEIGEVCESVDIETEVFIHGALCMSVSGQCYLSGMLGTRSGNRGACAGTCRLPFSLHGKQNEYALSLKDLCAQKQLEALCEADVTSLKIEGRMKRPEYVAAAAAAYRNELDGRSGDFDTLRAVFSRSGFTDGYLAGERGRAMFGVRQREDVVAATEKLYRMLRNTYKTETGRVPLSMHAVIRKDSPVVLTARDADGHTAYVEGAVPETAQNRPATEESIVRVLSKLGGTIFAPDQITAEVEDGLMVPVSEINACRRSICGQITKQRETPVQIPVLRAAPSIPEDRGASGTAPAVYARFERFLQLSDEALSLAACFSLPLDEVFHHRDALFCHRNRLMIELPRLMFGREQDVLCRLSALKADGFQTAVCENIAHIALAKQCGMKLFGGAFLNCTNSRSAQWLSDQGLSSLTLSFEMRAQDISRMKTVVPRGIIACGHLPLMLWRNCPAKGEKGCAGCTQRCTLTDRYGKSFSILCMRPSGSAMLNGDMLWTADKTMDFGRISFVTCYFTTESAKVCGDLLLRQKAGQKPVGAFTRGLYYRSI